MNRHPRQDRSQQEVALRQSPRHFLIVMALNWLVYQAAPIRADVQLMIEDQLIVTSTDETTKGSFPVLISFDNSKSQGHIAAPGDPVTSWDIESIDVVNVQGISTVIIDPVQVIQGSLFEDVPSAIQVIQSFQLDESPLSVAGFTFGGSSTLDSFDSLVEVGFSILPGETGSFEIQMSGDIGIFDDQEFGEPYANIQLSTNATIRIANSVADLNADGDLNSLDTEIWAVNRGFSSRSNSGDAHSRSRGDLDQNGKVDYFDFNMLRNEFSLAETDPPLFNQKQLIGLTEVERLRVAIQNEAWSVPADMNADGIINKDDLKTLIVNYYGTWLGDSNLDGEFNSSDLIQVFKTGGYNDQFLKNSIWQTGDWTGDGEFDPSDLIFAFQDGGYEQGIRRTTLVPEPDGIVVLLSTILLLMRFTYTNAHSVTDL